MKFDDMRWEVSIFRRRAAACLSGGLCLAALLSGRNAAGATGTVGGFATFTHAEGDRAIVLNRMNRNDNEFSTLRLNLEAQITIAPRVTLNMEYLFDEAAYGTAALTYLNPWVTFTQVLNRPWLNLQVGKLPLAFGTWGERVRSLNNPVIGVPLLSGYHTSLKSDALPLNGDLLLARAGLGQFGFNYGPSGNFFKGMPVVYEACWDTGVEVFGAAGSLEYAGMLSYGTPGAAIMNGQENNDEPGFTGRLGLSHLPGPLFGARVGVSAATGAYLPRTAPVPAGHRPEEYDQIVFGTDLEYGLGPVVVRSEIIRNRWEMPEDHTPEHWLPAHVDLTAWFVESRVDITPMIFLGGRYDAMKFDKITSPTGDAESWDESLHRIEVGATWRPDRNWAVRYSYQMWRYVEYRRLDADLYALQLRMQF